MRIGIAGDAAARKACFDIRRAVFIEEQQIPEAEEWDAYDDTAIHFLAKAPEPAATARLIRDGEIAKIGRVAVMESHRGTGLGRAIMEYLMSYARDAGVLAITLDGQVTALPFYEKLGFVAEGPEFDDGSGIMHRRMRCDLLAGKSAESTA